MTAIDDMLTLPEQAEVPRHRARNVRVIARRVALAVVAVAARVWVGRHKVPGVAGAALVSAGCAVIVDYVWPGVGWGVLALVAGGFCLAADRRMP